MKAGSIAAALVVVGHTGFELHTWNSHSYRNVARNNLPQLKS